MSAAQSASARPLPELNELNRAFWTSGASGALHIQRCATCARLIHPPALLCPDDHSRELAFVPVSGRGTVETWTVNEHSWLPGFPDRYVIAYVTLAEDGRARILTNLVGVESDDVSVGMPVRITFEHHTVDGEDVYVPLFEPADG